MNLLRYVNIMFGCTIDCLSRSDVRKSRSYVENDVLVKVWCIGITVYYQDNSKPKVNVFKIMIRQ